MHITFKLFALLERHLPASARPGNEMPLELPEGTTIVQAIQPFALPPHLVKLVLVNGVYVAPQDRSSRVLVEGDVLAIWPPVAGG